MRFCAVRYWGGAFFEPFPLLLKAARRELAGRTLQKMPQWLEKQTARKK
jgi:hypothetical protein